MRDIFILTKIITIINYRYYVITSIDIKFKDEIIQYNNEIIKDR